MGSAFRLSRGSCWVSSASRDREKPRPCSRSCDCCPISAKIVGGEVIFEGRIFSSLPRPRCARFAARNRDDLPGADDLAQSGVHGRRSDQRSDCAASEVSAAAPRTRSAESAGLVRHSRRRERRLDDSASAIGRHAPTRDDRDGAVVQARSC